MADFILTTGFDTTTGGGTGTDTGGTGTGGTGTGGTGTGTGTGLALDYGQDTRTPDDLLPLNGFPRTRLVYEQSGSPIMVVPLPYWHMLSGYDFATEVEQGIDYLPGHS